MACACGCRRYVNALAAGNLGGRLGWGAVSDRLGRRNTFWIFTLGSIPLYGSAAPTQRNVAFPLTLPVPALHADAPPRYLSMPHLVAQVTETGGALPLYGFVGSTVLAVSFMGGMYAILPAYEVRRAPNCAAAHSHVHGGHARKPHAVDCLPHGQADTFGSKYVGANHGRMLLWSSGASVVGPAMLLVRCTGCFVCALVLACVAATCG